MNHSETKRKEHPDLLQIVNNRVIKIAILILMSSKKLIKGEGIYA